MARLHLGNETPGHISDVESTALLGDNRMKEHLQENVAQFFAHLSLIAVAKRIVQLVRFFDEVRAERVVGLGRIPLAASSQVTHERERIFKRGFSLHSLL